MASISDLKIPMLLKIFEYYLETEGYANLVRNISNVCTSWRNICKIPSLWVTYDGSLSFEDMMMVCEGGFFENTLNFKISSCDSAVSVGKVSQLFSQLENVNVINLSNLKHITPYIIEKMGSKCTKLQKIRFGNISCKGRDRSVSEALDIPLKNFFSRVGSNLLSVNLSYCKVPNFSTVITWIADECPNLNKLCLVYVETSNSLFPTRIVQKKCPKLKVLRLDYRIKPSMDRWENGFPNLDKFVFKDKSFRVMNDAMLYNILFSSSCLKSLIIPRCDIDPNTLFSLPTNDLRVLRIPKSTVCLRYESNFIEKWRCSLRLVDFSFTCLGDTPSGRGVNPAVMDLISFRSSSPLEELYLCNTPVRIEVVDAVLKKCSELQVIDLEKCEYLPLHMQFCFEGEWGIVRLKHMIRAFLP